MLTFNCLQCSTKPGIICTDLLMPHNLWLFYPLFIMFNQQIVILLINRLSLPWCFPCSVQITLLLCLWHTRKVWWKTPSCFPHVCLQHKGNHLLTDQGRHRVFATDDECHAVCFLCSKSKKFAGKNKMVCLSVFCFSFVYHPPLTKRRGRVTLYWLFTSNYVCLDSRGSILILTDLTLLMFFSHSLSSMWA